MLDFNIEWLDAQGVTSNVLSQTWARLVISVTDVDGKRAIPSQLIDASSKNERDGIYGSVFPLAEWVVENWWFLLNEPQRTPELPSGRRFVNRLPAQRDWATRHNLLTARHGGALPDLFLYRDQDQVVAAWTPDPYVGPAERAVRFIGEGLVRLDPQHVERGLESFVRNVLSRLDGSSDAETARLRAEWNALCESRRSEAQLCSWAASIGLDPYDPGALTDNLIELLEGRLQQLDSELRADLIEATTASEIEPDLDWIATAGVHIGMNGGIGSAFDWTRGMIAPSRPNTAHEWGYQWAEKFRQRVDIAALGIDDLPTLLHKKCQWPRDADQVIKRQVPGSVNALVAADSQGCPRVARPGARPDSTRFLLARALFFVPRLGECVNARLATRAYTWEQAASRAFAAELLAPADALRAEITGGVTQDQLQALAERFQVSAMVVEHQIINHRIGWIEDF